MLISRSLAACIIIMVSGCASQPVFTPQSISSADKALVYFYRPPGETLGYTGTYYIDVNQRRVVVLMQGRYFPYEVSPGKLTVKSGLVVPPVSIASRQEAELEIDVEPGNTYYVRMHPVTHLTSYTPKLSLVSKESGHAEIANCQPENQ